MSDDLKQKFLSEVGKCALEMFPDEENKDERDFVKGVAKNYYEGSLDDSKLKENLEEVVEDSEKTNNLLNKIKTLKAKHMPKPVAKVESVPEKKKQEPSVEKKEKGDEKAKVEDKPRKQSKGSESAAPKAKIFERIEGGIDRPSKKVKKDDSARNQDGGIDEENGPKENLKKKLQTEGKQKCRFFPFCKNEEGCEFFHPTEKV